MGRKVEIRKTPYNRLRLDFDTAKNMEKDIFQFDDNYFSVLASQHEKAMASGDKIFNRALILSAAIVLYISGLVQDVQLRILEIGQLTGVVEIGCLILSAAYASFIYKMIQMYSIEFLIKRHINDQYAATYSKSFALIRYLPSAIFGEITIPRSFGFKASGGQKFFSAMFFLVMILYILIVVSFPAVALYIGLEHSFANPGLPQAYTIYINIFSIMLVVPTILMAICIFCFPYKYTIVLPDEPDKE